MEPSAFEDRLQLFYDRIGARLDEQRAEVEQQHAELKGLIEAHEAKLDAAISTLTSHITAINAAFLHDNDSGKPDYMGHYSDHKDRKTFRDWLHEQRNKIASKVLEYLALLFLAWLGLQMWDRAAKGPDIHPPHAIEAPARTNPRDIR